MRKLTKTLLKLAGFAAAIGAIGSFVWKKISKLEEKYKFLIKFTKKDIVYNEEFYDESVAVLCSKVTIDLTENDILNDEASLEIFTGFSDVTIYIPENFEVYLEGKVTAGDLELDLEEDIEKENIINLYYNVNFSKLTIKSK